MVQVSWEEHTARLSDADRAFLMSFRQFCLGLPDVSEQIHRTEITFSAGRFFAAGFILSHRLELAIQLLDMISHPRVIATYRPNQQVIGYRLSLPTPADFDDSIRDLIVLAHDQVGYGLPLPRG